MASWRWICGFDHGEYNRKWVKEGTGGGASEVGSKVGPVMLCGCIVVGTGGVCGVDMGGKREKDNRMGGIMVGRGWLAGA